MHNKHRTVCQGSKFLHKFISFEMNIGHGDFPISWSRIPFQVIGYGKIAILLKHKNYNLFVNKRTIHASFRRNKAADQKKVSVQMNTHDQQ